MGSNNQEPGFAPSFVIKNEIVDLEEDSMECERPILMRSRDDTEKHVQYLTPIITKIPDRHQFPIIRLIKEEPIDQLTKQDLPNQLPAKKRKSKEPKIPLPLDNLILLPTNDDNEQDKLQAPIPRNARILLPNPLFQLRERLNKVVSQSTSTGTQETSSSRINLSTAAATENSSTSTYSDSSMFYIDVSNLDRTESEASTNSISTILNIKEELDNNLNSLQNEPSRRIQPNPELTSNNNNNGGDFICRHCKMAFMYSGQLLRHLKSHLGNRHQQKPKNVNKKHGNNSLPKNLTAPVQQTPLISNDNNAATSTTTNISAPRLDSCKQLRIVIPKVEIEISSSSDSELDSLSVSYIETGGKNAKRISTLKQLPTQTQASTLGSSFDTTMSHPKLNKPINACNICGKTFKGRNTLKMHLLAHTSERPFECQVCHQTYKTLSSLSNHNKVHVPQIANSTNKNTNTKELQCKNCGTSFGRGDNLQRHISNRTCWKQPFRCGVCNKIFTTRQSMCIHVRCHTGEKPYACCDINFRTQGHLDIHKKQHTFNCNVCGEGFIQKILLEQHMKTNTHNVAGEIHSRNNASGKRLPVRTKSKPINSSGKRLPVQTRSKQKRRRKLYYSDKRFRCSYCSKIFHTKQGLCRHEMIHKLNEKQFSCALCSMKFSSATNLKIHRTRKHKGPAASKSFTTNVSTNNSTTSNNQQKPYLCSYCPKSFSQKAHLVSHTRRHTGEKPYPCQYCPMRFVARCDLAKHTRTHTGEKPYTCTYCPRKFAQKTVMTSHTRTHTGEKPYTCTYCPSKFALKQSMLSHTKTHANGKYPCNTCKSKFSTLPSLSFHYQNSIQCKEV